MDTGRIERIVDAAAAELGSAAVASDVRALSEAAAARWPKACEPPECVQGVAIELDPGPQSSPSGRDTSALLWDLVARAIQSAPDLPVLIHLRSLGEAAGTQNERELAELVEGLHSLVVDSGQPALRLLWADAIRPERGDRLVLNLLGELTHRAPTLCGHVRVGAPGQAFDPDLAQEIVHGLPTRRPPIGLAVMDPLPPRRHTPAAVIAAIATPSDPPCTVAVKAWCSAAADGFRQQSGLAVEGVLIRSSFDTPGVPGSPEPDLLEQLRRRSESGVPGIEWV